MLAVFSYSPHINIHQVFPLWVFGGKGLFQVYGWFLAEACLKVSVQQTTTSVAGSTALISKKDINNTVQSWSQKIETNHGRERSEERWGDKLPFQMLQTDGCCWTHIWCMLCHNWKGANVLFSQLYSLPEENWQSADRNKPDDQIAWLCPSRKYLPTFCVESPM